MASDLKTPGKPGMTLLLKRTKPYKGGVIGRLYLNNQLEGYTLEDLDYLIPTGTYRVTLQYSVKFKCSVILVHKVPGRSHIEIHPGNFKDDSKGCIVIGISHTDTSVVGSRAALKRLIRHFGSGEGVLFVTD